jgi:branched-chain amino acid transport system substrate-binding protein
MMRLTRRQLIQASVVAAGRMAFGLSPFTEKARAQPKEVVMLGIWPFTGPLADSGPLLDRGMKLAIEEWDGKVLGRPIKYITRDSETKAGAATRRVEEAIDSENVKFIIGPWSSGVALAVTEVAKRRKVLHYFSGGTEELSGKRCHRYAFQWAASPYTASHMVVDKFMELHPQAKRWYLFVLDFTFGWSVEKYIKIAGQKHGVELVGTDRMPLGTREYSGVVSKAAAAKPDVLCLVSAVQDFILQVREAHNFGLAPKVALVQPWGLGSEELAQLDAKTRENLWTGTNGYYTIETRVAKKFTEMYEKRHGIPPGYAATASYSMTRLVLRSVERANSTEPADVVKALEGWETEDWPGKMWINPKTHQTVRDFFFLRCKRPEEMNNPHDYGEIVAMGSTPFMPDEFNECKEIGSL